MGFCLRTGVLRALLPSRGTGAGLGSIGMPDQIGSRKTVAPQHFLHDSDSLKPEVWPISNGRGLFQFDESVRQPSTVRSSADGLLQPRQHG